MREHSKWECLSPEQTRKFVDEVSDPGFAPLFAGKHYELWAYGLSFLEGYSRYRLSNTGLIPDYNLDYISNGENHYYLDGSAHPVILLIQRDAFRLRKENVLSYLDFFDDVVFDPEQKVKFIVDAYDTGYAGATAMEHHFKAIDYTSRREIEEFEHYFLLKIPVLFNGETIRGDVRIEKSGHITINAPVLAELTAQNFNMQQPLRYAHPHNEALLKENSAALEKAPSGKMMMDFARNYHIDIKFISGITRQGFITYDRKIFIAAPCDIKTYAPYQAVDLAGALRDCEINQMTGDRQSKFPPEIDGHAEENHGRNLDILLTWCKMGDELNDLGDLEFLRVLRKAGMEPLYNGYKDNLSLETLMDIYAAIYCAHE
ncbi:MAG: hypothetical protein IT559_00850 [Alphaproteobacteria bacterium]|nr:hypothetical protein [Alphaproteobacteria bacterium]